MKEWEKSEAECHVTSPSLSGTTRFSLRSHATNTCASCQRDKRARGAQTVFYITADKARLIKETIGLKYLKVSFTFKRMKT